MEPTEADVKAAEKYDSGLRGGIGGSGTERDAYLAGLTAAREQAANLISQWLLFNDQRAISWHEAADCQAAILRGDQPREKR